MRRLKLAPVTVATILWVSVAASVAVAQSSDPAQDNGKKNYVSQEDYQKLKREVEELREKVKQLTGKEPDQQTPTQEDMEDLQKELKRLKDHLGSAQPGTTRFLVTGYAFGGFLSEEKEPSTFNAGLAPIILWRLSDRIFVEGEIELELEDNETEVHLEFAQVTYILNDYVTIGAGKFLTPFGNFFERFHPAWINKLPDVPLALGEEGLAPPTEVGVQVRGAVPIAWTKFHYAVFVSNGPRLNIGDTDAEEAGLLRYDNFEDLNNNKAAGGRIGLFPIAELEVTYSFMAAQVGPRGGAFRDVDAMLHSVDLAYQRDSDLLKGTIDIKFQWVWSFVDRASFDPTGALGFGPVTFRNRRYGGYVQLAYRPSKVDSAFLKNLELIVRYDALELPRHAPRNVDEDRWTLGIDYWLGPSTVIKLAWRIDDRDDPAGVQNGRNAFLVQFAIGF